MYEFDCHYGKERWQTGKYFDLIKEFLIAAQNGDNSDDCEPPPCPTTPQPETTEEYLAGKHKELELIDVLDRDEYLWSEECWKEQQMEAWSSV